MINSPGYGIYHGGHYESHGDGYEIDGPDDYEDELIAALDAKREEEKMNAKPSKPKPKPKPGGGRGC